MQRILALALVLFFINKESKADCNPAFTFTVQSSTVQVQASNTAPHLFHSWHLTSGAWAFAYGPSASFNYLMPGTYIITHRVVDSVSHCEDSVQQSVTVNFQVSCAAHFAVARDSSQVNRYRFYSTSVFNGGFIYAYVWRLNGTVVSYDSTFSRSLAPGRYSVCLTISTTGQCTSSICDSISIVDTVNCNWSASFTATASATNPKQISFTPNPSLDRLMYTWDFGDGSFIHQKAPVHTYSHGGTYNVRLSIVDTATFCNDTTSQLLQVQGVPCDSATVSFTYAAVDPDHPNQIHFTANSNQTITSQTWVIIRSSTHDSTLITLNNPTYTFTDTGYHTVCLYITTAAGCAKWTCNAINIDSLGARTAGRIPSYPNPATSSVKFRVDLNAANRIGVTIYNTSGYIVYKTEKQGNSGSNEITIPVQQLNSGQYFIDIKYGDKQKRSIFQKL